MTHEDNRRRRGRRARTTGPPAVLLVPVAAVGAAAAVALLRAKPKYEPPPAGPVTTPDGRANAYRAQIQNQYAVWQATRFTAAEPGTRAMLRGVLEVVEQMAAADAHAQRITQDAVMDIDMRIAQIRRELP